VALTEVGDWEQLGVLGTDESGAAEDEVDAAIYRTASVLSVSRSTSDTSASSREQVCG
jgi:hypothetical protein